MNPKTLVGRLSVGLVFVWNACTSSMRPSSIAFVWRAAFLGSATMLGTTALALRRGGRVAAASFASSCGVVLPHRQAALQHFFQRASNAGTLDRLRRKSTVAVVSLNHFEDQYPSSLVESVQQGDPKPSDPIEILNAEIATLNGGEPINCNSRKQVSLAVFGREQNANRDILKEAINDPDISPNGRKIAERVLKVRMLLSKKNTSQQQNNKHNDDEEEQDKTISVASKAGFSINNKIISAENSAEEIPDDDGLSSYERQIEKLFSNPNNRIDPCWKDELLRLSSYSTQKLVGQLRPNCPFGFHVDVDPKDPTAEARAEKRAREPNSKPRQQRLLEFCRKQKEKYSNCIILTRVGEFYETYGIDAILLVEYCGLNSMAGKAKAGCPKVNVHATLADLTNANFQIAVFEELPSVSKGDKKKQAMKDRFLTQIVTPAQPTYIFNNCMSTAGAEDLSRVHVARPYIGVISTQAGYTVVEVSMEEHTARISERMTSEAVACLISTSAPVDPLLYVPSESEVSSGHSPASQPRFVPTHRGLSRGASQLRIHRINPTVVQQEGDGISHIDRAKNVILSELLRIIKINDDDFDVAATVGREKLSAEDFTVIKQSNNERSVHPLYLETATQLGLMDDRERAIPSIVSHILPAAAPSAVKGFIRRKLLVPLPPLEADSMRELVKFFREDGRAVPSFAVPNTGKILSVLRMGEASAEDYGELLGVMTFINEFLDLIDKDETVKNSLMALTAFETGVSTTAQSLKDRCFEAMQVIEKVLCPSHHVRKDIRKCGDLNASSIDKVVPDEFFRRNEATWRGRVRREVVSEAYENVEEKALKLANAVAEDFWNEGLDEARKLKGEKSPVVHDIINNDLYVKSTRDGASTESFIPLVNRDKKKDTNKKTTDKVQKAVTDYKTACEEAHEAVSKSLSRLSKRLVDSGHIPALVQASHGNLILSATFQHASKSNSLGWGMADIYDYSSDEPSAGHFKNLWPYWMKRTAEGTVTNTFDLEGIWTLTAPNMSGKSTIMRSTAAATLLTVCGLAAPLEAGSRIRRFDHLFVRGASSDVPAENMSAFGAEMADVAALLRSCGQQSLVFVDELGRGTSPRDGTRIAGALLEHLALSGISGVFATHLHDVLSLPFKGEAKSRMILKRMAVNTTTSKTRWMYKLEDGICTDSMALVTAQLFGVTKTILQRAEEFDQDLPDGSSRSTTSPSVINGSSPTSKTNSAAHQPRFLHTAAALAAPLTSSKPTYIAANYQAPPSFSGKEAVYILKLASDPPSYYVGQTSDMNTRIREHRKKKGHQWTDLEAVAFLVSNHSQARFVESQLIQKMAQKGYNMESTHDAVRSRSQ